MYTEQSCGESTPPDGRNLRPNPGFCHKLCICGEITHSLWASVVSGVSGGATVKAPRVSLGSHCPPTGKPTLGCSLRRRQANFYTSQGWHLQTRVETVLTGKSGAERKVRSGVPGLGSFAPWPGAVRLGFLAPHTRTSPESGPARSGCRERAEVTVRARAPRPPHL